MTNIRSHLWGENVDMGDAGPQRISHYAIIRLLNEGPISYTYLGKDEQRKKRYVILKVFNIPLGERLRITDFSPMPQELLQPFNHLATRALLYKAPEYLRGTLTSASDQYSLAVIVYEWLCGQRPYKATGHDELLYQQEHEQIPSPRSSNSKISSNVEAVILKALSPQPADRFEHILKFSDAYLRALMGFPLTKNIDRKQVVLPVNPPAINTTHISNRINGDAINKAITEEIKAHVSRKDENTSRTNEAVKPKVSKREDH